LVTTFLVGGYHPVKLGEKFRQGRYVVLKKLGWGHFSTVWLVLDTHNHTFAALKVWDTSGSLQQKQLHACEESTRCWAKIGLVWNSVEILHATLGASCLQVQKSASHYTEAARDEITLLSQISAGDPDSDKHCCKLLDSFEHFGPHGLHVCMVFEVLGDNLLSLIKAFDYKGVPLPVVRTLTRQMLVALDYLHRCAVELNTVPGACHATQAHDAGSTHICIARAAHCWRPVLLTLTCLSVCRLLALCSGSEQCCLVLALCCRQLSIIHTDFKPENVMLVETLQPRHWEMVVQQPTPAPSAPAAAAASASPGQLTKNQKKKAKRKAKKAGAAASSQEVSHRLRSRAGHLTSVVSYGVQLCSCMWMTSAEWAFAVGADRRMCLINAVDLDVSATSVAGLGVAVICRCRAVCRMVAMRMMMRVLGQGQTQHRSRTAFLSQQQQQAANQSSRSPAHQPLRTPQNSSSSRRQRSWCTRVEC
jgi:hypothetical protein